MARSWDELLNDAGGPSAFDPLPNGDYEVTVTKATQKPSASGKKMFNVEFTVQSGPFARRKIWSNLTVSPENPTALSIFFRQMNTLGLNGEFFKSNPTDEAVCSAITGKACIVQTQHREWQGQTRVDVNRILPAGPGANQAAVPGIPTPSQAPSVVPGLTTQPATVPVAVPVPVPAQPPAAPTPAPAPAPASIPEPAGTPGNVPPPPPF